MVADIVRLIPTWMVAGLLIGGIASLFVAMTFYLGDRLFPPTGRSADGPADGSARRRAEIREYLGTIGERFVEAHALGDVTVDFYLPGRDVAITFDAHDYFRLEGTGTYTVLVEDELPGHALGKRLPFAVPDDVRAEGYGSSSGRGAREDFGFGPGGGPRGRYGNRSRFGGRSDPVTAAFAELDLDRSADEAAVKRAYRDRAKQVHPDRGGDRESFSRLQEAYATARNHASGGRRGRPPTGGGIGRPSSSGTSRAGASTRGR